MSKIRKTRPGAGGRPSSGGHSTPRRAHAKLPPNSSRAAKLRRPGSPALPGRPSEPGGLPIVELAPALPPRPFRVIVAVHRPRFRGRCQRAAALQGWEVTALLNKQDVVGAVARNSQPPDILILSGDFGRQKDYAIFRAIQSWRGEGMRVIGLVEDCDAAPEGYPDSAPSKLCDICITPPIRAAGVRALLAGVYEELRSAPAPPPLNAGPADDDTDEDEG